MVHHLCLCCCSDHRMPNFADAIAFVDLAFRLMCPCAKSLVAYRHKCTRMRCWCNLVHSEREMQKAAARWLPPPRRPFVARRAVIACAASRDALRGRFPRLRISGWCASFACSSCLLMSLRLLGPRAPAANRGRLFVAVTAIGVTAVAIACFRCILTCFFCFLHRHAIAVWALRRSARPARRRTGWPRCITLFCDALRLIVCFCLTCAMTFLALIFSLLSSRFIGFGCCARLLTRGTRVSRCADLVCTTCSRRSTRLLGSSSAILFGAASS